MPRRRQLVVRFTEEEFAAVRARAELAGLAVGAWIGQTALDAAGDSQRSAVGLPDLLRLHADVLLVAQRLGDGQLEDAGADVDHAGGREWVAELLERLDGVIDAVVVATRSQTSRAAAQQLGVAR